MSRGLLEVIDPDENHRMNSIGSGLHANKKLQLTQQQTV